ncbi:MAG: hypothetical protein HYR55_16440 [Acidobacteria bacterium]|nr:hypothetical protein [Acidobacteriota bacterium]MBI3658123.1 hypothetical protein [Acidobacteriota bacterium]
MMQIRKVQTHTEYEQCVDLQQRVWGFSDRELVPSRTMIVAQKHGGCVLGAFSEAGELVGFALSFASFYQGRFAQHSSMLAVQADRRDHGVGRRLKLAQRQDALARGIEVITWTFDPLETRNAHLNLNKLGAVAAHYLENHYPQSSSEIYSGLGTDRFLAEWWIGSERVRKTLEATESAQRLSADTTGEWPCVNRARLTPDGLVEPGEPQLTVSAAPLLVEVPSDINQIKLRQFNLAVAWRENTRGVLRHFMNSGLKATRLLFEEAQPASPVRRAFYLLEREFPHEN